MGNTQAVTCNTVVTEGAKAIAVGSTHVCMIIDSARERNKIQCWGSNKNLQAGRSSGNAYAYDPDHFIQFTDGTDVTNAVAITAGRDHTCAIINRGSDQGAVYCWGSNDRLASGLPTNGDHTHQANPILFNNADVSGAPFNIPNNTPITGTVFIASGAQHNCAIVSTSDGNHLFCWGSNSVATDGGYLGRPRSGLELISSERALLVAAEGRDLNGTAPDGARPTSAVAGDRHTCVRYGVMEDSFKCFGSAGTTSRLGFTGSRNEIPRNTAIQLLP